MRLTAQSILATHLRDTRAPDQRELVPPNELFWEGSRIDLNHATLIDLDFRHCHLARAEFRDATFAGVAALFHDATFDDVASFSNATFEGIAVFTGTTFQDFTMFPTTTFNAAAWFRGATFDGDANFEYATFGGDTSFRNATFGRDTQFTGARLTRLVPPEDNQLSHDWPSGWTVRPAPGGGGILQKEDTERHAAP
ncbi:pentapeptide repeat-containing protein [Streptomyces sp. NPDC054847]